MSVEVRQITKRFPSANTPAVQGVTFAAPHGAITSLLGPSGSGKSTILRIIAGLESPDDGQVLFGEDEVTRMPVQKRGVGFVFQSYALFKHMNVRENIAFGLTVRPSPLPRARVRARVDELLSLVQLDGFGDRYPAQLSGGQRQRVAFARALAIEPKILLLDEPFGALDAKVRLELRDWLRRFHDREHVTTLLVTHDQEEAMELSQHVVLMHEGKVAQAGAPHEIYDHPKTPFVAQFLGGQSLPARGNGKAFVRPHEVKLTRAAEGDEDADAGAGERVSVARVDRLVRVGATVKVMLVLADGGPMTVELPHAEATALALAEGDRVLVDLRQAKLFLEDYSI
jgi:sulfate transport system ATP-binding protein